MSKRARSATIANLSRRLARFDLPRGESNCSELERHSNYHDVLFIQALSILLENNELANIFSVCRARPHPRGEIGCSELKIDFI